MATVRPFRAVRPEPDKASQVAALPYDVMSSDEAREEVKGNPYSFLHVDKAEIDLDKSVDLYDGSVYEKARENLYGLIEKGVLIQDNKPCFYIYRLTMDKREQYGLVACTAIDEYLDETIKKHELTLESKEQDRIRHVDRTNANTGPIFLAYRNKDVIDGIVNSWVKEKKPVYDFCSDDGISHTCWIVDEEATVKEIEEAFSTVPNLYIADGHHRNASAVKVGLKRRGNSISRDEEYNYYLSVLFPENQLKILDYNRVVKDLNGLSEEEFLSRISENFEVEKAEHFKPEKQHSFGMYLNKKKYILTAKESIIDNTDCVAALDVSILQKYVLTPVLGIDDPRTNKRIDFVGGIRGLEELEERAGGEGVAFAMYPTSVEELMVVADGNKIMPPKSTWFEPKLRSGLFIHLLSDE